MKARVSAVIINYNTGHFLKTCIESLLAQDYQNREIIFIDNDSKDTSCEFVRKNFADITCVRNGENLGYAAAANQGIKMAGGEYVMIINPDIIIEPDYIGKCIGIMESDRKIAAICGKIYKYDFENNKKTDIIDTVGLFCFRNRRIIDEGQGIKDDSRFNERHEVFGVSGACPIYRKSALEDVKVDGEYLDNDFFMYKEDIDISWRLRLFGWKCFYLPDAIGFHGRGTGVLKRFGHFEVMKNRGALSRFTKYYSYKNQRLMQMKNEFMRGFLRDFFPIVWKEILVFGYILFREPYLIKAFFRMLGQMPKILRKRKYIMKHARVSWREMEKWLSNKKPNYL